MNELKQAMAKVIAQTIGKSVNAVPIPKDYECAAAILDMPEIKQALQNTVALDRGNKISHNPDNHEPRVRMTDEGLMGDASTRKDEGCSERVRSADSESKKSPTYTHEQVMKWQPIETAPKDGTEILIYWNSRNITVGFWARKQNEWWPLGRCTPLYGVTHWMPLPLAPFTEKGV